MSTDDPFARRNQLDPSEVQPVEKKSGCLKWVLIFGGIGLVGTLICCGVAGFVGYQMKPTVVNTPPEVTALAQEITDIAIPAEFVGKAGVKMNLGFMAMTLCQFEHTDNRGMLQLMEMKISVGDPKEGEAQLKEQMRQQGSEELKTLNVEKSETREVEIRGEPASFTISEGTDVESSTKYHEVKGQFKGKNGVAILQLQLEEEAWDAEAIDAMIESIK